MASGKPPVRAGPNGSAAAQRTGHDDHPDPLQQLAASVSALRDEVGSLAAARFDQFRLAIRDQVFGLVAKGSGLVLGLVILAAAVMLVMFGVALGLSEACGGRLWLGCVLSGVLFLVSTLSISLFMERGIRNREYRRMEQKYARSKRDEAATVGPVAPDSDE